MNQAYKTIRVALSILLFSSFASCKSESAEPDYTVDFSYQADAANDNRITFTNHSTGDYLYTEWDFGNGESTSKETDKSKTHTVLFRQKGDYEVSLKVWGPLNTASDTKVVTKTISIEKDVVTDVNGTLIWSDEFDGSGINASNWSFETGDHGWGNNELQNYTAGDNVSFEDGKLVITARKVNDDKVAGSYTSARLVTLGKKEFTYGRMEIRAKLPAGTGIWPAIWMLGTNIESVGWPACGEIDIMEYVGYQPNTVHSTVHTPSGYADKGNGSHKTLSTCEEEFHIYGLIWTADKLIFYTDSPDNVTHIYAPENKTAENWPFDKPHFFILNLAVGGNWGGAQGIDNSIFPQSMAVDYVRVYELD